MVLVKGGQPQLSGVCVYPEKLVIAFSVVGNMLDQYGTSRLTFKYIRCVHIFLIHGCLSF